MDGRKTEITIWRKLFFGGLVFVTVIATILLVGGFFVGAELACWKVCDSADIRKQNIFYAATLLSFIGGLSGLFLQIKYRAKIMSSNAAVILSSIFILLLIFFMMIQIFI